MSEQTQQTDTIPAPTAGDLARDLVKDYREASQWVVNGWIQEGWMAAIRLATHLRTCRDQLAASNAEMADHITELRIIIDGLTARVASQSDQLSQNAERSPSQSWWHEFSGHLPQDELTRDLCLDLSTVTAFRRHGSAQVVVVTTTDNLYLDCPYSVFKAIMSEFIGTTITDNRRTEDDT